MKVTDASLNLIKTFEGLRLHAYPDSGGIWTIGYGCVQYPDGTPVKKDDVISDKEADEFLLFEANKKAAGLNSLLGSVSLNENQYNAILSFSYNVGLSAFKNSTLFSKMKLNVNDPTIAAEFKKWNKVKGHVSSGLTKRRAQEAKLYFS